MPAARHPRPALDVSVSALRERARRRQYFPRMLGIPGRHRHLLTSGHGRRAMPAGVIGAAARIEGPREPRNHYVRQQHVAADMPVDVAVAVAPAAKLLDDPRGEPDGRGRLQFGPPTSPIPYLINS
jgi:hypothetical protein